MKLRKEIKGCRVMGIFVPRCNQNTEKDSKLENLYFSSNSEESKSLCIAHSMIRTVETGVSW